MYSCSSLLTKSEPAQKTRRRSRERPQAARALTMNASLLAACAPTPAAATAVPDAPHIALILVDDLDLMLGGLEPLPATKRLLAEEGVTFALVARK